MEDNAVNANKVTYNVAIVTTFYKSLDRLSKSEHLSLSRLKHIYGERDLFFIHPSTVNAQEYVDYFYPFKITPVLIPDRFFGSLDKCNLLLMQSVFYRRFKAFDYILIYHTDAYIFNDELDKWCALDYDYIGAPWFVGNDNPIQPLQFKGVGNGGFSLRKTSSFLRISQNTLFRGRHLFYYWLYKRIDGHNYQFIRKNLGVNWFQTLLKKNVGYEDEFWGMIVPRRFPWFKVAPPSLALKFSFEVLPRELYKLNNNTLPFGCHAWEKQDHEFWAKYIS